MMIPALLASAAVFLAILAIGRAMGPTGEIGKKKEISKRIFDEPISSPEFINLLRQEHLSDIPRLQKILEKQEFTHKLALWLKRSGSRLSLSSFLLIYAVAATLIFFIAQFFIPIHVSLLLAGACLYLPFLMLRSKNQAYLQKFSEHLPDATSIISNNLKVGQSIESAIDAVGRNAAYPVSSEFQSICGELKLGLSLDAALRNMYARIQTPELKIFIIGITIQQELGGNLSEIMENLEKTIRERFALEREIKVLSAQGVFSMWVLLALPFVFAGVWTVMDRELLVEFATSPFGIRLMLFSLALQMFAFYIMKKTVSIKD